MIIEGIALGLVIGAILGLVGAGGAIIAIPGLIAILGVNPSVATTAGLVIVGSAATAGFLSRLKSGNVNLRIGMTFALMSTAGTFLGSRIAAIVSDTVTVVAFSALMLLAAFSMWRGPVQTVSAEAVSRTKILIAATGVGLLTGFLGVGGGFLIVPALVAILQLPVAVATGTSLVAIAGNSLFALLFKFESWGEVPWSLVLVFAAASVVASVATAPLVKKLKPRVIQKSFAIFVIAVAGYLLTTL